MPGRGAIAAILTLSIAYRTAAAVVSGRIAAGAAPAAQARVTLFTADVSNFRESRSAADGSFRFESVPAGAYRLGVAFRGWEYDERTVAVETADRALDISLVPETNSGAWQTLGRFQHDTFGGTNSGVLLPSGRILYCHDTRDPAIFDPATAAVDLPPASPRTQGCHAVRLLQDGTVIYVGGADVPVYGPGTKQVKRFDPARSTWEVLPDLTAERWYPSLVQLAEGELLAIGGGGRENPLRVKTCEVMDPASRVWTRAGDIAMGNEVSPIVLLQTGEVLMTHRPPQLFDPRARTWRKAADFVQGDRMPNGDHADHEIVQLDDGRVVAIGYKPFGAQPRPPSMVEIYDPAANQWRLGSTMAPLRSRSSIVLLPDGRVLALGGSKEESQDPTPTNSWGYVALTDVYDPELDSWRRLAQMAVAREYHAMPLLVPDGRVIVTGGEGQPGVDPDENVIEGFRPPYLFRGVRPEIRNIRSTAVRRGDALRFEVERTEKPTQIVLIGTGATTHFMDSGNARLIDLPFTLSGRTVYATIPRHPNRVPLGHYILFALVDDIPSAGTIVRIDSEARARRRAARH